MVIISIKLIGSIVWIRPADYKPFKIWNKPVNASHLLRIPPLYYGSCSLCTRFCLHSLLWRISSVQHSYIHYPPPLSCIFCLLDFSISSRSMEKGQKQQKCLELGSWHLYFPRCSRIFKSNGIQARKIGLLIYFLQFSLL